MLLGRIHQKQLNTSLLNANKRLPLFIPAPASHAHICSKNIESRLSILSSATDKHYPLFIRRPATQALLFKCIEDHSSSPAI
jgi:hypothetical protein